MFEIGVGVFLTDTLQNRNAILKNLKKNPQLQKIRVYIFDNLVAFFVQIPISLEVENFQRIERQTEQLTIQQFSEEKAKVVSFKDSKSPRVVTLWYKNLLSIKTVFYLVAIVIKRTLV